MNQVSIPGIDVEAPGERREHDFYPTPPWATRLIVPVLKAMLGRWPATSLLEPAAGDGRMAEVLVEEGLVRLEGVAGVEIQRGLVEECRRKGLGVVCADFLLPRPVEAVWPLVVTNPPYDDEHRPHVDALAFVRQALRLASPDGGIVAMLLRQAFLESDERQELMVEHPPDLHILPRRPPFVPNRDGKMGSGKYPYAWFVWQRGRPMQGGRFNFLRFGGRVPAWLKGGKR